MRLSRLIILSVSGLLVTACGVDDGPTVNARPQLAGVRFIHAMPDEGPVDARMIDLRVNDARRVPAVGQNFAPWVDDQRMAV